MGCWLLEHICFRLMLLTLATPMLQPQTRAEMLDRLSDQELAGFSANVLSARYVDTAGARHEIPPPDIDGALQDPLGQSACTWGGQLQAFGARVPRQVSASVLGGATYMLSKCCHTTGATAVPVCVCG